MQEQKRMLHIKLAQEEISPYVFLPGSPERVERIAAYLEQPIKVAQNREHTTYAGYLDGKRVLVVSTGMGGPSTAICLEELIRLGAKYFIRVGTCASTSPKVKMGDVVLPNAAIRMEGTGNYYLPIEFPAVPDYQMLKKMEAAVKRLGYEYNVGITITKDAFYVQIDPESLPVGYDVINKWNAYEKGGATNTCMECATLFLVAASRNVHAAAVLVSANNYKNYSIDAKSYPIDFEARAVKVALGAMQQIIAEEGLSGGIL